MASRVETCDLSLPDIKLILKCREDHYDKTRTSGGWSVLELIQVGDEAESLYPTPDRGRFGRSWHYDKISNFICCDASGDHYEIELDRLDLGMFPLHLSEKSWVTPEIVGEMIYLLKEVFGKYDWSPVAAKKQGNGRG